eukprot:CAMPEP_0113701372 /NCGR_PEP_ID=MMETSP0038_2-20120614/24536_1 /TAXON_ID=2898 /ORGANISM="Cryptomonas paramecium" /LENGTH=275 /DNA_ID=CAMNT_0000625253 /DNA_START=32 /DNA_END=856 /DNA_ORIENTATION=+ /assembly_acc=CAM_ASM_000170
MTGQSAALVLVLGICCWGCPGCRAAAVSPCQRGAKGAAIREPVQLTSSSKLLDVKFQFRSGYASDGTMQYCFITDDGSQSPTLIVSPGDHLRLKLTNNVTIPYNPSVVGGDWTADYTTNLHFHGMFLSPSPGQDFVFTAISPGQSFTYDIDIPADHPSGLYWYHPQYYGRVAGSLFGGASGLIIVQGLEQARPDTAGLPVRTIAIRDQHRPQSMNFSLPPSVADDGLDLSINFVPVAYPDYTPALAVMMSTELWRVAHAGADAVLDLQLLFDGVP